MYNGGLGWAWVVPAIQGVASIAGSLISSSNSGSSTGDVAKDAVIRAAAAAQATMANNANGIIFDMLARNVVDRMNEVYAIGGGGPMAIIAGDTMYAAGLEGWLAVTPAERDAARATYGYPKLETVSIPSEITPSAAASAAEVEPSTGAGDARAEAPMFRPQVAGILEGAKALMPIALAGVVLMGLSLVFKRAGA